MEIDKIRKPHNPVALAFNDLQSQSINFLDYRLLSLIVIGYHWKHKAICS